MKNRCFAGHWLGIVAALVAWALCSGPVGAEVVTYPAPAEEPSP